MLVRPAFLACHNIGLGPFLIGAVAHESSGLTLFRQLPSAPSRPDGGNGVQSPNQRCALTPKRSPESEPAVRSDPETESRVRTSGALDRWQAEVVWVVTRGGGGVTIFSVGGHDGAL
jgi:hypothetical protein